MLADAQREDIDDNSMNRAHYNYQVIPTAINEMPQLPFEIHTVVGLILFEDQHLVSNNDFLEIFPYMYNMKS